MDAISADCCAESEVWRTQSRLVGRAVIRLRMGIKLGGDAREVALHLAGSRLLVPAEYGSDDAGYLRSGRHAPVRGLCADARPPGEQVVEMQSALMARAIAQLGREVRRRALQRFQPRRLRLAEGEHLVREAAVALLEVPAA